MYICWLPLFSEGVLSFYLESEQIYTSRDVKFVETVFSFKNKTLEGTFERLSSTRQHECTTDDSPTPDSITNSVIELTEPPPTNGVPRENGPNDIGIEVEAQINKEMGHTSIEPIENNNDHQQNNVLRRSERAKKQPKHFESYEKNHVNPFTMDNLHPIHEP